MDEQADRLVEAVRSSGKYRAISTDLIANVAERERAHHRNLKDATKATRNKLHQIAGAFFEAEPRYASWHDQLAASVNDPIAFRNACSQIMRAHASTRERLPLIEEFYRTTLAGLPPVRSVIDLACGLNPLAIPWMPLADDATYYACDIYHDLASFLNSFFEMAHIHGRAEICNLAAAPFPVKIEADLALILKAIPTLNQIDKDAGRRLLASLQVKYALVSFPARSLGGRNKGMAEAYEAQFHGLIAGTNWPVERFLFANELVFLVHLQ